MGFGATRHISGGPSKNFFVEKKNDAYKPRI